MIVVVFFFFSSRRRHTRWTGDWSSDVCSSDLLIGGIRSRLDGQDRRPNTGQKQHPQPPPLHLPVHRPNPFPPVEICRFSHFYWLHLVGVRTQRCGRSWAWSWAGSGPWSLAARFDATCFGLRMPGIVLCTSWLFR